MKYEPDRNGSQWVYETLRGKYKMMFYSGNVDGVVSTTGSL